MSVGLILHPSQLHPHSLYKPTFWAHVYAGDFDRQLIGWATIYFHLSDTCKSVLAKE